MNSSAAAPELALDARYYTDPQVYEQEKEQIFFRTWQYAGHTSRLEKPGDYFAFQVCDQNLFALRDTDGEIRAFYNVCQHRAHELLSGSGNTRFVVCPYHAWSYHTNGQLRRAPNSETVPGFDASKICLHEVRTEVFCGFLFVNLDADTKPMAEWYPKAADELREYVPDLERLRPLVRTEAEEACNWKVTVENYNECYHCRVAHPTFVKGVVEPDSYNVLPQGYCLRHTTRTAPAKNLSYAYDPDSHPHATDYSSWFLWPSFSFQVYPGNVLNTYHWFPHTPTTTTAYREWLTPDGAESEAVRGLAQQDLETTVAEDVLLVNSVQRGLHNRGYRPGPLVLDPATGVNSEHSILALKQWVLESTTATHPE